MEGLLLLCCTSNLTRFFLTIKLYIKKFSLALPIYLIHIVSIYISYQISVLQRLQHLWTAIRPVTSTTSWVSLHPGTGRELQPCQGSAQPSSLSTCTSLWRAASTDTLFSQQQLPSPCGDSWGIRTGFFTCLSLVHSLGSLNILGGRGWVCSEKHCFQNPSRNQQRFDATSVPSALSSAWLLVFIKISIF